MPFCEETRAPLKFDPVMRAVKFALRWQRKPLIRGAIPISGVFDMTRSLAPGHDEVADSVMRNPAFGETQEERMEASPVAYLKKGGPPFLIIYAAKDPERLREQSQDFHAALEKLGERTELIMLEKEDHLSEIVRVGKINDKITDLVVDLVEKNVK